MLYTWKFLLNKNFAKPSYLCIAEKVHEKNFANVVKVATSSMQSLTQDKKNKFLPRREGGEIGEKFCVW